MENKNNNELIVNGKVLVNDVEVHNIFGEFGENQKSALVKEIANVHGVELKHLNEKINRNIKRFRFGIDIIDLKGTNSEVVLCDHEIYTQNSLNRSNNVYLFSRKGYLKLVGILEDDLAYDIQDKMIDEYFELKELEITKEDKLCLSIIKANSQEGRMVAVGELVEYKNQQIAEKDEQLMIQAPKVAMADRLFICDAEVNIGEVAKLFNEKLRKGKSIGRTLLFEILREHEILMVYGSEKNNPRQKYIDNGCFVLKTSTFDNGYGGTKMSSTTKVTPKGIQWLWNFLIKKGYIMIDDVLV